MAADSAGECSVTNTFKRVPLDTPTTTHVKSYVVLNQSMRLPVVPLVLRLNLSSLEKAGCLYCPVKREGMKVNQGRQAKSAARSVSVAAMCGGRSAMFLMCLLRRQPGKLASQNNTQPHTHTSCNTLTHRGKHSHVWKSARISAVGNW